METRMHLQLDDDDAREDAWPNPDETRRMAAFARACGVTVTITPTGAIVSAPRDPRPHHVTGFSCDCGLFAQAGGCPHYSLLVDTIGWTPEMVGVECETAVAR